jgi:hypothetical protein
MIYNNVIGYLIQYRCVLVEPLLLIGKKVVGDDPERLKFVDVLVVRLSFQCVFQIKVACYFGLNVIDVQLSHCSDAYSVVVLLQWCCCLY